MLRFLFNKYRSQFEDFFLEDLIGNVPKQVSDDSLKFLAQGKEKLEKWNLYQVYLINRKMAANPERRELYLGYLLYVKTQMVLLARFSEPKKQEIMVSQAPKVDEDLEGVSNFHKEYARIAGHKS